MSFTFADEPESAKKTGQEPGKEPGKEPAQKPPATVESKPAPAPGLSLAPMELESETPPAPAAKAAPPAASAQARTSVPAAKPAPRSPQPEAEPDNPELKPGSRKDLWNCPHCGTGNKPDRNSCRDCGKSPSDPVIRPWTKNPVVLGGIAASAVALFAIVWFATRPNLEFRQPGPGAVDRQARLGSGSAEDRSLDGNRTFETKGRISVVGRVLTSKTFSGGGTTVALALGTAASDDTEFKSLRASSSGNGFKVPDGTLILHLVGLKEKPARGTWLSLVGDRGVVTEGGRIVAGDEGDAVVPDQLEMAP